MEKIYFEEIVVLGYGKVASDVLLYVHEQQQKYGYQIELIEYEWHPLSILEKICSKNSIKYLRIPEKENLTQYLKSIEQNTLIISANNNYLFPDCVICKDNITIINFHNALLPNYPGRNAPSWAIYYGEKQTGITWHYVTKSVDAGNIIIQKTCEIGEDTRAYELAKQLMGLAIQALQECFYKILTNEVLEIPQKIPADRKIFKSAEIPANAQFHLEDEPINIYRLLRCLDYGKNDIFPVATTKFNGKTIQIIRYQKILKVDSVDRSNTILCALNEDYMLQITYITKEPH